MIETGPKKEDSVSKSIDVSDIDLKDAKIVAKFLCKIGFLDKEPIFLKGTLIRLLQRYSNESECFKDLSQSLHFVVLALFSRKELLESE